MIKRLRAKSWDESFGPPPESIYLPQHLYDVLLCCESIIDATGTQQLSAFGIDPATHLERFRKLCRISASCHDLGKANSHFQKLVYGIDISRTFRQAIRHEWISWFILNEPMICDWLLPSLEPATKEVDWHIIQWSVTGHHPAFGRKSAPDKKNGSEDRIELYLGEPDFRDCLRVVAQAAEISELTIPYSNRHVSAFEDIVARFDETCGDAEIAWIEYCRDPLIVGLLAAAKNCLVAADVAGSALPSNGSNYVSYDNWRQTIVDALTTTPKPAELDALINDRLTVDGKTNSLRPFQVDVANKASEVTLVKAGCGSGKTLAAYHWAHKRCPGRRLYICYPTTGTATEGFRDYLFDKHEHQPRASAELFHSRAHIDCSIILGAKFETNADEQDSLSRIRSLKSWEVPIVSCTVDSVLGIMNNLRRPIYSWPAICNAAFVFDEIHAYDSNMFGSLLKLLIEFRGIPVLLMTASLPTNRLERLRAAVKHRGDGLVEIGGPNDLEALERYEQLHIGRDKVVDRIVSELKAKGKILWVSNTVARTMASFRECEHFGINDTVYHSRFRYIDRIERHKAVIEAFRREGVPAIAWTSQVAEMSLDLSASLLVTELASIPALIQRLGRLNRRATDNTWPTKGFIIIEPVDKRGNQAPLPYTAEQLEEARIWLASLPSKISQADLVKGWEAMPSQPETIRTESTWLDGGFAREVKELRQSSPGITVILEEDIPKVRADMPSLLEVTIPMNPRFGMDLNTWPSFQHAFVVNRDQIEYSELTGGEWK